MDPFDRLRLAAFSCALLAACSTTAPHTDAGVCACPASPPPSGTACDRAACNGPLVCAYNDCAGTGRTTASCLDRTWEVATTACAAFACPAGSSTMCNAGEVCVERRGGALLYDCQRDPCGNSPVSCACAASVCAGGACEYTSGETVTCNTCSQPVCP